jgi:hypothetical protein
MLRVSRVQSNLGNKRVCMHEFIFGMTESFIRRLHKHRYTGVMLQALTLDHVLCRFVSGADPDPQAASRFPVGLLPRVATDLPYPIRHTSLGPLGKQQLTHSHDKP